MSFSVPVTRYLSCVSTILLLTAILPFVFALADASPVDAPVVLKPVHPDVLERSAGLRARSTGDLSRLSLAGQTQLVFGGANDDGQYNLANMTLYAPSGLKLISMEVFDGLTSAVDCEGDDGTMSLTFKSKSAQEYALKEWSFINEEEDLKFILIANHAGCGPDDERQAYTITNVDQVEGTLKTLLSAVPAPWKEVAGTFDLDFGKISRPKPQRRQRVVRGFFDDLADAASGIVDDIGDGLEDVGDEIVNLGEGVLDLGDVELTKSASFDISAGTPGQRTNILGISAFNLDCVDCFLQGRFEVTGRVSIDNFIPKTIALDASPSGVKASLQMEASIKGSVNGPQTELNQNKTIELFSAPIPGAGIEIPKIFELGAIIELNVVAGINLKAEGTFTFGLTASLNDGAKVSTDLVNVDQSSASGFGVNFDPNFGVERLNGSVTLAAAAQPKLKFGLEVLELGKLDVFLAMKLPEVTASLEGIFDRAGACEQTPGAADFGARISSSINVDLSVGVDASISDTSKPLVDKSLFSESFPLLDKCFPFGGDTSDPSPSPSPSSSSTPAISVQTASPTPTPTPSGLSSLSLSAVTSETVSSSSPSSSPASTPQTVLPTPVESLSSSLLAPTLGANSTSLTASSSSSLPVPTPKTNSNSLTEASSTPLLAPTPASNITSPLGSPSSLPPVPTSKTNYTSPLGSPSQPQPAPGQDTVSPSLPSTDSAGAVDKPTSTEQPDVPIDTKPTKPTTKPEITIESKPTKIPTGTAVSTLKPATPTVLSDYYKASNWTIPKNSPLKPLRRAGGPVQVVRRGASRPLA
ncbi:MAG: hypothetical protein M1825_002742 [Sarcosagium campestre]|nr:MAG: hypothetical protein M1825_002742 [Sarcosagium campestre]